MLHSVKTAETAGVTYTFVIDSTVRPVELHRNDIEVSLPLQALFYRIMETMVLKKFGYADSGAVNKLIVTLRDIQCAGDEGDQVTVIARVDFESSGKRSSHMLQHSGELGIEQAGYSMYTADRNDLRDLLLKFVFDTNNIIDNSIPVRSVTEGK